jgi:hypothetical protein
MRRAVVSLVALLFLGASAFGPAAAQEDGGRYYPETGHILAGQFVAFYDAHGGLEVLGYPITDAFVDPFSGWLIQYTQYARMELVPVRAGTGVEYVRLSSLGEALGGWQPPLQDDQGPFGSTPGCRFFPESHHNVCHAFLDYFDGHGGPPLFGFPISEFTLENDRIVQYFQGFRLDWYPEEPGGGRVRVAPLGRMHFEIMGYDPALLRPRLPSDMMFYQVTELRPRASVWQSVSASSGAQQVYLVVRDQNSNPITRAATLLIAHFPDGDRTVVMPLTDENGVSQLTLSYEAEDPGSTIGLEFWVVYGELQGSTRDSFRIWW